MKKAPLLGIENLPPLLRDPFGRQKIPSLPSTALNCTGSIVQVGPQYPLSLPMLAFHVQIHYFKSHNCTQMVSPSLGSAGISTVIDGGLEMIAWLFGWLRTTLKNSASSRTVSSVMVMFTHDVEPGAALLSKEMTGNRGKMKSMPTYKEE